MDPGETPSSSPVIEAQQPLSSSHRLEAPLAVYVLQSYSMFYHHVVYIPTLVGYIVLYITLIDPRSWSTARPPLQYECVVCNYMMLRRQRWWWSSPTTAPPFCLLLPFGLQRTCPCCERFLMEVRSHTPPRLFNLDIHHIFNVLVPPIRLI